MRECALLHDLILEVLDHDRTNLKSDGLLVKRMLRLLIYSDEKKIKSPVGEREIGKVPPGGRIAFLRLASADLQSGSTVGRTP
jgi:hypothetical protein